MEKLPKKIDAEKLRYDILYRCLCNYIKLKAEKDGTISPDKLNYIFGTFYRIPKEMRSYLIAELIEIDFLRLIPASENSSLKRYSYKVLL